MIRFPFRKSRGRGRDRGRRGHRGRVPGIDTGTDIIKTDILVQGKFKRFVFTTHPVSYRLTDTPHQGGRGRHIMTAIVIIAATRGRRRDHRRRDRGPLLRGRGLQ